MTERGDGAVYELLKRRWRRRDLILQSSALAATGLFGCSQREMAAVAQAAEADAVAFATIDGSAADTVVLPDGFASDVLLRWGDPLVAGSDGVEHGRIAGGVLFEAGSAARQATAFGTSCDGMGLFPLGDDRLVVCVNHETPETGRMFPGWTAALRGQRAEAFVRENPQMVAVMRAAVGVSVVEIERDSDRWRVVADSALNRRITADTEMLFAGPAARHPWLGGSDAAVGRCLGTLGNCAAGATPWGTYLTAEENTNDFFGNAENASFDPLLERANERFGMRRRSSVYRWEVLDERFDHALNPTESMKFGWIVEIDPLNPGRPIRKRTALGRFKHEGATAVLDSNNRPVVYMGDDEIFEYFYKFVGARAWDSANPDDADTLLDEGTLYVARCNDDGSGDWLPLVHGQPGLTETDGFSSQADIVLRCREAADIVGATPLDRPEDVAVHPHDGRVYLACTAGVQRGLPPRRPPGQVASDDEAEIPGPDPANPRGPNPHGHILEFSEADGQAGATAFRWEVFVLAGDPAADGLATAPVAGRLAPAVAYYAGRTDPDGLSAFANPDNLGFDQVGNLWIVTDGSQPNGNNNGCFVCPTDGDDRGFVRQFMSGPVGAEVAGCTFSPDGKTLFLCIQHPGGGSAIGNPSSHWPDGGDTEPRSSLIAVRSVDAEKQFFV